MAIEIRELVIKALIVDDRSNNNAKDKKVSSIDKEEIIQECVNQALKIIRKSKNR